METKCITSSNFMEIMFEVDKHKDEGWKVMKDPYPHFNFIFFEVYLSREVVEEKQQESPVRKGRPAKNATENKE